MNILHLTDLHFTYDLSEKEAKKKWESIICKIVEGCKGELIQEIAVTGDLTCHGAKEEFDRAGVFLSKLLDKLYLKKEQVMMCQGNHDADTDDAYSSFSHYEHFVEKFYDGNPPKSYIELEGRKYCLLSMNTCHETSLELYENATLLQEECERLQEISEGEKGILLLHHPPETIRNQELFEKIMESGKICLILSGHQHMSQPRLYKAGEIAVVGGMAISPHRKWMAAGCQIVHISQNGKVNTKQIDLSLCMER